MKKILFQEADFYGASKLIYGKKRLPFCYRATWMHGISPIFRKMPSSDLLIHYNEKHMPIHLVNNNETVKILKDQGLNSIAIGMPYIYTKAHSENNKKKILFEKIFMPPHSIIKNQEVDYSKWKIILNKYKCDAICLAWNDYYTVINKKIDFGDVKIIKGAHSSDDSSLTRMSEMFYNTNEMITNTSGSHLVYAAASNVKVKVIDEIFESKNLNLLNNYGQKIINTFPKKYRKKTAKHIESDTGTEEIISRWNSKTQKEAAVYANFLIGTNHKKDPKIVKNYLTATNKIEEITIASHLLYNKIKNKLEL